MMSMVSAVWWNPFTWFDSDENIVIEKGGKWMQDYSTDNDFFLWFADAKMRKTEVCLLSETATKLNDLEIHKNLYGKDGEVIEQMNRKKKQLMRSIIMVFVET